VKVIVAPDRFGAPLDARAAADAVAGGWRRARPADELVVLPVSDGGEGLLDAVARPADTWLRHEVVGPHGQPVQAEMLLREDGSAVIEASRACGLALLAPSRRTPLPATTFGVGQLLDVAREAGAHRILVGLGGTATVDGGAGALTGLGFRLRVADGSGLKIGGGDLHRIRSVDHGWVGDWRGVEVLLLAPDRTLLGDAARRCGPAAGASDEDVAELARALDVWAEVAERDLAGRGRYRDAPGSGAGGGLGFGLACALGARLVDGPATVAGMQGLPAAIDGADLVVTGGGLAAGALEAGAVAHVTEAARAAGLPVAVIVGTWPADAIADPDGGLDPTPEEGDRDVPVPDPSLVERAVAEGPGREAAAVVEAARRLASRR
jgi:glycerate 2-kinase